MVKKHSDSYEKGFGFGITSATITTLGMIVGLDSATHSFGAVVGGIIAIAVADAFSDALGMHVSEESQKKSQPKKIWVATAMTFLSKFIFAGTFLVPFMLFELQTAVYASIAWGMFMLIVYNFRLAKLGNQNPFKVIGEHLLITVLVIILTHYVGNIVALIQ
jgi:VIT1/CCC1 family predicted Fe2+/Mn2+ transporter